MFGYDTLNIAVGNCEICKKMIDPQIDEYFIAAGKERIFAYHSDCYNDAVYELIMDAKEKEIKSKK